MSPLIFTKSPYLGKTDPDCIVVAFDKSSGLKAYFEQTPEQAIAFGCALIKEAERALAETRADERAQEIALQVLAIVRQPAAALAEAA
jgi:hypothetical protein